MSGRQVGRARSSARCVQHHQVRAADHAGTGRFFDDQGGSRGVGREPGKYGNTVNETVPYRVFERGRQVLEEIEIGEWQPVTAAHLTEEVALAGGSVVEMEDPAWCAVVVD